MYWATLLCCQVMYSLMISIPTSKSAFPMGKVLTFFVPAPGHLDKDTPRHPIIQAPQHPQDAGCYSWMSTYTRE